MALLLVSRPPPLPHSDAFRIVPIPSEIDQLSIEDSFLMVFGDYKDLDLIFIADRRTSDSDHCR